MLRLYKTRQGILLEKQQRFFTIATSWDALINQKQLYTFLSQTTSPLATFEGHSIIAPIESQEVWASGVTYFRSKKARMEESKASGGDDFYDKVYEAERPELFFKSLAHRVAGPGEQVNIRKDACWNVPEPELTLCINRYGEIFGYTIGNDMSSRDIEGENPLYLPQAKTYERSAAIGPCILILEKPISPDTPITMSIFRKEQAVFQETIAISQMKRQHTELVEYLYRECDFPNGCYLMTGTGIIPPDDFTLQIDDVVRITIEPIGTLENTVGQKKPPSFK